MIKQRTLGRRSIGFHFEKSNGDKSFRVWLWWRLIIFGVKERRNGGSPSLKRKGVENDR